MGTTETITIEFREALLLHSIAQRTGITYRENDELAWVRGSYMALTIVALAENIKDDPQWVFHSIDTVDPPDPRDCVTFQIHLDGNDEQLVARICEMYDCRGSQDAIRTAARILDDMRVRITY